jgi:hypothetical protein
VTAARAVARFWPKDADRLLRDPKLLVEACNYRSNPAFFHADQRTEAYGGERMVDVALAKTPSEWAASIAEWLYLSIEPFKEEFAKRVPPLRVTDIQKGSVSPGPRRGTKPKTRRIVIPSFLRRCISNLFTAVLLATADHLFA